MGIGDMRSVGGQRLRQNGHGWMETEGPPKGPWKTRDRKEDIPKDFFNQ